jgi:hypothetical protein
MLDELRRVYGPYKQISQFMRIALPLLAFPLSVFMMSRVYRSIVEAVRSSMQPGSERVFGLLIAGTLAVGCLAFLAASSELFREIADAKDRDFLKLCPLPPLRVMAYRIVLVSCRTVVFLPALILYPFYYIWSLYDLGRAAVLTAVTASFVVWCGLLSLWVATYVASLRELRFSRKSILLAFNIVITLISLPVFYCMMDRNGWADWTRRFNVADPSNPILLLFLAAFVISGALLFLGALRSWPEVRQEQAYAGRAKILRHHGALFSEQSHWAILQKDFKDLIRNPAYKHGCLCCLMFFPLVLWSQWKSGTGAAPSSRRMMASLSLIYLVPALVSSRTVSIELRMLGLYRLALPKLERLLDLKWRAQSILNCAIVGILAFPYFVYVRQGTRAYEPLYLCGCVVAYVPLQTMLALTSGAFFPSRPGILNPIGMGKPGMILYFGLSVILFSLLLNYLLLGVLIYSAFLVPFTLVLYFGARRYLLTLCGRKGD